MATNQQAVNSAAINSARAGRLLVTCVIAASAAIAAPPTHKQRVTLTFFDDAVLDSKVDQTHQVTQGVFSEAVGFAQEQVYRLPTAIGFAHAHISALARGADGGAEFEVSAEVHAVLNTLRAIHAVVPAVATGFVDDTKLKRVLLSESDNATATATIISGYKVQHAGDSHYTHYDVVDLRSDSELTFVPNLVRISSAPWRPFAGATFEALAGYKYKRSVALRGEATLWADPVDNFYATAAFIPQAVLAPGATRVTPATAILDSEAIAITPTASQRHAVFRPPVVASATLVADTTVMRAGGYVMFSVDNALAPAEPTRKRSAIVDAASAATIQPTPYTWRYHYAETNILNEVETLAFATVLGYDIVTFERPAEPREFVRGAELKEFTRARI